MGLRYVVEFKVMPQNLFSDPTWFVENILSKHEAGVVEFYNFVAKQTGEANPYTESDFKAGAVTLGTTHFVFKINMPTKDIEPPLCRSIIITVDGSKETLEVRYFTEEYEDGKQYFIGEVKPDGTHVSHGIAPETEHELMMAVYSKAFGWDVFDGTAYDEQFKDIVDRYPSVRNFVERLYMRLFYLDHAGEFLDNAIKQEGYYFYSIFRKAYQLAGQRSPYKVEDFKFVQLSTGQSNHFLFVLALPTADIRKGDALQIVFSADVATGDSRYLTLQYENNERALICKYDPESEEAQTAIAPSDRNELTKLIFEMAFDK